MFICLIAQSMTNQLGGKKAGTIYADSQPVPLTANQKRGMKDVQMADWEQDIMPLLTGEEGDPGEEPVLRAENTTQTEVCGEPSVKERIWSKRPEVFNDASTLRLLDAKGESRYTRSLAGRLCFCEREVKSLMSLLSEKEKECMELLNRIRFGDITSIGKIIGDLKGGGRNNRVIMRPVELPFETGWVLVSIFFSSQIFLKSSSYFNIYLNVNLSNPKIRKCYKT